VVLPHDHALGRRAAPVNIPGHYHWSAMGHRMERLRRLDRSQVGAAARRSRALVRECSAGVAGLSDRES